MKKLSRFSCLILIVFLVISCSGGGGGAGDAETGDNLIPETTKVLDESTMQNLTSVSEDGSVLTFSQATQELESLSPGNVIISDTTASAPDGLLRRVTTITKNDDQVIVYTEPATLEDAIQRGSFEVSTTLTQDNIRFATALIQGVSFKKSSRQAQLLEGFYVEINDVILYDDDGNYETTDDQIKANGGISVNPSFTFGISIDDWQLKQLTFTNTTTETAQIELEAQASILEIDEKREIARYNFTPITVWVSYVPVVITPVLTVNVGLDGEVSVGITTSVTQEATLTAGLSYDNGEWSPISDFSNDFQFNQPSLSAGCKVKVYAGPQLNLLIYGLVGPYGEIDGNLELDADIFSTPWWELYGGLEAGIGVRLEVLSHLIADFYYPEVIGYRLLLAQAETPFPIAQGTISGSVKDAVNDYPIQDVTVDVYSDTSLITSGITDSNGAYSLSVPSGSGYRIEFSKTGYLPITYYDVSVEDETTTYLETVLQIDEEYSGTGDVSGSILNALDGTGVSGLTIELREGINVTSGTIVAATTTDSDGSYSFTGLNAGNYTAEISGSGYNTTYCTVICIGGTTTANQDATITPVLSSGETRIILTWGETPRDIDSHLTGPTPDGDRFHIYFANKTYTYDNTAYDDLDLDDVTSYGPETVTIYQQIDGDYRYSVHDYTNRNSSSSTALSNSGAQVRVYRGTDLIATFNAPAYQEGTLWTVFELSGDTITPINSMSYESSPSSIQSVGHRSRMFNTDAEFLRNLPDKH